MSKIRVLFTIPNFDTAGSGKAMLNIAQRLNKDIFESHVACLNEKGVFFEKVKQSGVPYHILPLYSPLRPITKMIGGSLKLSKIIKQINPDIVHSFHYASEYSEALAVRLAGKKWVFTKKNMSWVGSSTRSWKIRSFLANGIAVQNTDMMKDFYPNSKKTTLIPRGVNTKEFYPRPVVAGLREKWNISPDAKVILCVANLVPVKGIEILLAAFKQIREKNPAQDSVVLVVGDNNNDYGRKLLDVTAQLGLEKNVIYTGKQQNVSDYHTIADVFVLPTLNEGRREGSPVALLEALACGTISIASDIPGIRDQLRTFPDLMFHAGNADELAQKLTKVLASDEQTRSELKKKLIKHVDENYRIEIEVERHEKFYLSCLGR